MIHSEDKEYDTEIEFQFYQYDWWRKNEECLFRLRFSRRLAFSIVRILRKSKERDRWTVSVLLSTMAWFWAGAVSVFQCWNIFPMRTAKRKARLGVYYYFWKKNCSSSLKKVNKIITIISWNGVNHTTKWYHAYQTVYFPWGQTNFFQLFLKFCILDCNLFIDF